jgi:hypothetical protein
MKITVKPDNSIWSLTCDEVEIDIVDSEWFDQFTLVLASDIIETGQPTVVTLSYNGPNTNLCMKWDKQIEPWTDVPSTNIGLISAYTDRGNCGVDFDQDSLTKDFQWHTLDFSAIVPPGASAILIHVCIAATLANNILCLSHPDNTEGSNMSIVNTQLNGSYVYADCIVATNPNREIKYLASSSNWSLIQIVAGGWFK